MWTLNEKRRTQKTCFRDMWKTCWDTEGEEQTNSWRNIWQPLRSVGKRTQAVLMSTCTPSGNSLEKKNISVGVIKSKGSASCRDRDVSFDWTTTETCLVSCVVSKSELIVKKIHIKAKMKSKSVIIENDKQVILNRLMQLHKSVVLIYGLCCGMWEGCAAAPSALWEE